MQLKDEEKVKIIEEIMEVEFGTIVPETLLDELEEWDSLSALALVALLDSKYGVHVDSNMLKHVKTVRDVMNLF